MKYVKIKNNTPKIIASLQGQPLAQAVMAGAFVIEGEVKVSMSAEAKTGRIYGRHQASSPGEPPGVDTGVLVNSIRSRLLSSGSTSAFAVVGTGVEYGVYLEFGTSKMKARPFMRPAFDNNQDRIKQAIQYWAKKRISGAAT
jgi:HK97 gp10 family phage protein